VRPARAMRTLLAGAHIQLKCVLELECVLECVQGIALPGAQIHVQIHVSCTSGAHIRVRV